MSELLNIAEAVKAEIDAALPSVKAELRLLPEFELKELRELKVVVMPHSIEYNNLTRGASGKEIKIDIGILKRTGLDDVPALLDLVEELAALFERRKLTKYPAAICSRITNDPLYSPEHLRQRQQFTSVLVLTFKTLG